MSSTQEGSCTNGGQGYRGGKGEKTTRRTWSPKEETALLASMKELVSTGWKSDNGFRGGYLIRLEDALAKEFPNSGIKGHPHIHSKIQNWKKCYGSLWLMLSRSGVGWNANGNHMVECNDEQWEQITKCDINAKPMRLKSWPMYEDWLTIFGKDRATGEQAEDVIDVVNKLINEGNRAENGKHIHDNEVVMEDFSVNDGGEHSSSHCENEKVVHKKADKVKKRKTTTDGLHGVVEIFGELCRGTNERLEMVANRIGYDFDLDQAKKDAYNSLENIPGLTLDDKFDICEIFTDQINRLLVFKGLPDDDAKEKYVHRLLKSKK